MKHRGEEQTEGEEPYHRDGHIRRNTPLIDPHRKEGNTRRIGEEGVREKPLVHVIEHGSDRKTGLLFLNMPNF
jgi:hypothetical protein